VPIVAILPIDIQALLVRMDSVSKMQQAQQEGISIAQSIKGSELSELAQVQSSRVNDVKPHPDNNSKIEDEQKKQRKALLAKRKKEEGREKKRQQSLF
ncbi:MAG: hypothetical protein GTO54_01870, partial [Nitrososphaeria archaeon]|nr:hypothetical protein [Nitrososphaeria archaeon]